MNTIHKVIIVCALFVISGCATTTVEHTGNRFGLTELAVGMTKKEVINLMGIEETKNYSLGGVYIPLTVKTASSPYRVELLQGSGKSFEILYYYTNEKSGDNAVTDDELTPIVFEGGRLVGWGWDFLDSLEY